MCNDATHINPDSFEFAPNHFKTNEICDKAVKVKGWTMEYVPDEHKFGKCLKKLLKGICMH